MQINNHGAKLYKWLILLFAILIMINLVGYGHAIADNDKKADKKGVLIVAVGLPGSGKSSVFRELGGLANIPVFVEPEWPEYVTDIAHTDRFTALLGLRAIRVHMLNKAQKLKESGSTVLVDSYYDKITSYYIDKPRMEWLINPKDKYFDTFRAITSLDTLYLPDADVIVFFDVDYQTWIQFLKIRNRNFDKDTVFLNGYANKEYLKEAVQALQAEKGIKVIEFKQSISTPKIQAHNLFHILIREGVLPPSTQ